MSYWNVEKTGCVQYHRHFLADNSVFHGEPTVVIYGAGSPLWFLAVLLSCYSGCECGLLVGLN